MHGELPPVHSTVFSIKRGGSFMHVVSKAVAYKARRSDAAMRVMTLDLNVRNPLAGYDSDNNYYLLGHEWLYKTRAMRHNMAHLQSCIALTKDDNSLSLDKMRAAHLRIVDRLKAVTKSYHYLYIRCGSKGVWGGGSLETRSDHEESY